MNNIMISNMVCRHCIAAVEGALAKADIPYQNVEIGKVTLMQPLDAEQQERLDAELQALGFQRIENDGQAIVESAKIAVRHHVRDERECRLKLSACIESQVGLPYPTVSRLFSQYEGRTLENYHQAQKIERVKEMLQQGRHSLEEIAHIVDYSSAAHLSRRFKEITGMTPTDYIKLQLTRTPLDEV